MAVVKVGVLHRAAAKEKAGDRYFIENQQKRYAPTAGGTVLGVVVAAHGEVYRVNIGASANASLAAYAFEGATRRNRPHLEIGPRPVNPECVWCHIRIFACRFGGLCGDNRVNITLRSVRMVDHLWP